METALTRYRCVDNSWIDLRDSFIADTELFNLPWHKVLNPETDVSTIFALDVGLTYRISDAFTSSNNTVRPSAFLRSNVMDLLLRFTELK